MKSIVVFCGSSMGDNKSFADQAYAVGKVFAEQETTLVYGGAKIGTMGKVAEGALDADGKVIGVIPDFLKKREVCHSGLTQLIVTENMHQRKMIMHELSEGIMMLPGGYGTLEEFFEMLTWGQLGLHQRPIGILNTNGFFDDLLHMLQKMVDRGFVKQADYDIILVDKSIEGLLTQMKNYKPLTSTKFIEIDQL